MNINYLAVLIYKFEELLTYPVSLNIVPLEIMVLDTINCFGVFTNSALWAEVV